MLTPVPPTDCMRAREDASALLDGELSELEAAHLDAHLRDCGECAAYARELGALTVRLRVEPPAQPALPIFVARRRRPLARLHVAAAAVTILAATGSSFAFGHMLGSQGGARSATTGTTIARTALRPPSEVLSMLRRRGPSRLETGTMIAV